MRTSHGFSKFLDNAYPYGTVYLPENPDKRNVLSDNLLRDPGKCILKNSNNENSPTMANITNKFYFGNPIDKGGHQNTYLKKYGKFCGEKLKFYLKTDTENQRLEWLKNGLSDLSKQINCTNAPLKLYFADSKICHPCLGDVTKLSSLAEILFRIFT